MSGIAGASPSEVPTFSECVIGYRAWLADDRDQLWPVSDERRPWLPGINTARCSCGNWQSLKFEWSWHEGRRVLESAPEHAAPDTGCECGLYSWRRPEAEWYDRPSWEEDFEVVGAVASWGHLQVHDAGLRAEHACIVTLAYHCATPSEGLQALDRIAARYGVELVPLSDLERAASGHGTPLPDTLRPPPDEVVAPSSLDEADAEAGPRPVLLTDEALYGASTRRDPNRAPGPRGRAAHYALIVVLGLLALALGLLALVHPLAGWLPSQPRKSDSPPVFGVGLLVGAAVLLGIAAYRAWWALRLDIEARRERQRHHRDTTQSAR